jgi:hypothetical protein
MVGYETNYTNFAIWSLLLRHADRVIPDAGDEPDSEPAAVVAAPSNAPRSRTGSWAWISRWTAGIVVLFLAAVLGGVALIAGYVRDQVLDTETYVRTVAPLAADPAIQDALAQRLANVIVTRADLSGIANGLAARLVDQGAPPRVTDLVSPLVSGIATFLDDTIRKLLGTPQFEAIWQDMNRQAHQGLVTVLTGRKGQVVDSSSGDTVTIDLGQLLVPLKQRLVDRGITFAGKIPNVSIPYTIVQSDKLPKIRTYVRVLDALGTWLPYVALVVFIGGFLTTPNRRRGILTGVVMLGVVDALLLAALAIGRTVYLDNLPSTVQSPQAAEVVYDTVLHFLVTALQAVLVAVIVLILAALLAGPSRPARWIRHQLGRALDAAGQGLRRTGAWAGRVGGAVTTIRRPVEFFLGALGVVIFILADHPTPVAVVWLTFGIAVVIIIVEILARMATAGGGVVAKPLVAPPAS